MRSAAGSSARSALRSSVAGCTDRSRAFATWPNGHPVALSSGGASVPAVPGLYRAVLPATFAFTAKPQVSPVTNDSGALHFDLAPTAAVLAGLKACLAKNPQVLEDPCHVKTATFVDKGDFRNTGFRWTLTAAPRLVAFASGTTYEVSSTQAGKAFISVFAVDLKNRYLPQRLTLTTPVALESLVDVTFVGRTPRVRYT